MGNISDFGKALAGLLVAAAGALVVALGPGNLSLDDLSTRSWVEVLAAVLASAAGIHLISNIPGVAGGIAKAVWTAATAGVGALLLAMTADSAGGEAVTQAEWLGVFVVAITAAGVVYQVPEKKA